MIARWSAAATQTVLARPHISGPWKSLTSTGF